MAEEHQIFGFKPIPYCIKVFSLNAFPMQPGSAGRKAAAGVEVTLTEAPKKEYVSIYSTDMYRGVIVPVYGDRSIGRIMRAGGKTGSAGRKAAEEAAGGDDDQSFRFEAFS